MMAAHKSTLQDFPEDGDFDMFPISPDTSTATISTLLAREPGTPSANLVNASIFPSEIPVLLYDDAYARESFAFESVALKVDSPGILPVSEQIDDGEPVGSLERLTLVKSLAPTLMRYSDGAELRSRFSTSSSFEKEVCRSQPESGTVFDDGKRQKSLTHLTNANLRRNLLDDDMHDELKTHGRSWNHSSYLYYAECGSPTTSVGESTIVEPPLFQEEYQPFEDAPGDDIQTFEDTPKGQVSKSSSWISSSDWNYQEYQDFVAQQETPPRTLKNLYSSQSAGYTRIHEHHSPESSPTQSVNSFAHRRAQPVLRPPDLRQEDLSVSWMKSLTVQFLIDQEGFRDAEPTFKFSGISQIRRYDQPSSSESIKSMAQFRPSSRQTFNFHYAPFEGPPILRRITVNNDETLDYVSRQAHLLLKSNGVYIVQGYEAACSDHGFGSCASKLYWQLEYLVDNRRMDLLQPQRCLEGEKTLTPLMFSCSPNLLLPRQGKKINIIHIFKKSVAQKLVADKLQPPGAYPVSAKQEPITTEGDHSQNLHRRTQSQGHTDDACVQPRAVSDHIRLGYSQMSETSRSPVRHRRVSSADQHQPSKTRKTSQYHCTTPMKMVNNLSSPKPSRHIIPPAQLIHLLDSPFKENAPFSPESSPRLVARPDSARSSRGFVGLSPRPKHGCK